MPRSSRRAPCSRAWEARTDAGPRGFGEGGFRPGGRRASAALRCVSRPRHLRGRRWRRSSAATGWPCVRPAPSRSPARTARSRSGASPWRSCGAGDGELRAMSNACRHRGTQLLDTGHGQVNTIVCPYHAWAFGLDGAFRGAPMTGDVAIDADAHCLPRFALEVFAGVVFVNVDGRARPLGRADGRRRSLSLAIRDRALRQLVAGGPSPRSGRPTGSSPSRTPSRATTSSRCTRRRWRRSARRATPTTSKARPSGP